MHLERHIGPEKRCLSRARRARESSSFLRTFPPDVFFPKLYQSAHYTCNPRFFPADEIRDARGGTLGYDLFLVSSEQSLSNFWVLIVHGERCASILLFHISNVDLSVGQTSSDNLS